MGKKPQPLEFISLKKKKKKIQLEGKVNRKPCQLLAFKISILTFLPLLGFKLPL